MTAPAVCRWCGMLYGAFCPSVRSIEFFDDGVTIKRVEFHSPQPIQQIMAQTAPWIPPYRTSSGAGHAVGIGRNAGPEAEFTGGNTR